jgi:hypothetical protein
MAAVRWDLNLPRLPPVMADAGGLRPVSRPSLPDPLHGGAVACGWDQTGGILASATVWVGLAVVAATAGLALWWGTGCYRWAMA